MPFQEFTARLDCAACETTFEGLWVTELLDLQQLDSAPVDDQTCPVCGHVHKDVEYPGWTLFGEAG